MSNITPDRLLLLYDGKCLLCNRFIQRILKQDDNGILRAASLQDYDKVMTENAIDQSVDSVVLIKNEEIFYKSDAVLEAKKSLSSLPVWYTLLLAIPKFIRDGVYDFIAANRYSWFGKSDECVVPPASQRAKYLNKVEELRAFMAKK